MLLFFLLRRPVNSRPASALTAVTAREKLAGVKHAPYTGELLELYKLCKAADR